jgi:hypothetical protein
VKKPKISLIGQDGNVFNLIGIARKALRLQGLGNDKLMCGRCMAAESYHHVLRIIMEYCEVS